MSAGQHTPGPWAINFSDAGIWYVEASGKCVATVDCLADGIDNAAREIEGKANARLIAAAPEIAARLAKVREALAHEIDGGEEARDRDSRLSRILRLCDGEVI